MPLFNEEHDAECFALAQYVLERESIRSGSVWDTQAHNALARTVQEAVETWLGGKTRGAVRLVLQTGVVWVREKATDEVRGV
jgi:hypothetical protein